MVRERDRAMPVAAPSLTLAEFLARPETKPASEFIDGSIYQKPVPQGKHSYLQSDLVGIINAALRKPRIARAGAELRCTFGGRSIVPDIAVFTWDRIPRDPDGSVANAFDRAPDWAIEILSPGQASSRPIRNILYGLEFDCAMGWVVDPEDFSVIVHWPDRRAEFFEAPDDRLPVPEFAQSLEVTVRDLLDCLQD